MKDERKHYFSMNYGNSIRTGSERWPEGLIRGEEEYRRSVFLTSWYRIAAPADPLVTATFHEREKARHGRLASIVVPVFIVFLFVMLVQSLLEKNMVQMVSLLVGLGISSLALFLNRRGLVWIAGLLIMALQFAGSTLFLLNYPHGLTVDSLPLLEFTVIPDMLVLTFFPARSLVVVGVINVILMWCLVMYGPHDAGITDMLRTNPLQIFAYAYLLQIIAAIVLYLWARSTEHALARADRAEEIVTLERREKERQEQELLQKRELDAGIQEILRTHVAVANGNLGARAPLRQDHVLWQVAVALNNLISRLQRLNLSDRELREQLREETMRTTGHIRAFGRSTGMKVDGGLDRRPV